MDKEVRSKNISANMEALTYRLKFGEAIFCQALLLCAMLGGMGFSIYEAVRDGTRPLLLLFAAAATGYISWISYIFFIELIRVSKLKKTAVEINDKGIIYWLNRLVKNQAPPSVFYP